MDPILKSQWVEALRSERYTQGRGRLRTADGGYCCLGVLCNVVGIGVWQERGERNWVYVTNGAGRDDHEWAYLPQSVAALLGTTSVSGPPIAMSDQIYTFPELNDEVGLSFAEIADLIEAQL